MTNQQQPFRGYSIVEALDETHEFVKEYNRLRRAERSGEHVDPMRYQDIRDQLSDALYYFGPTYADLKSDADRKKDDADRRYSERFVYWYEHYEGKRGTAELVKHKAKLDCEQALKEYNDAYRLATKARELLNRVDQVINGTASRLRFQIKHDYHEQ